MASRLGKRKRVDWRRSSATLTDSIRETLRDAIRCGEMPAGAVISELAISEVHRTSRTPVREAILQLSKEGIVQIIPNRGAFVATPSLEDMLAVLHLRCLIEPEIARLVATSAGRTVVEQLTAELAAMSQAADGGDAPRWRAAELRLQAALISACPNRMLGDLALQMQTRMQLGLSAENLHVRDLLARTEEHTTIVAAIAAGDALGSSAAVLEHLQNVRATFATVFI